MMGALWVFIGGGLGSVLRYGFGLAFSKTNLSLPYATLSANICSCFIFAISLWLLQDRFLTNSNLKLFILTGICGGLSTFSAFSAETFELFKQQLYFWGTANIILNTTLCVLIFYIFSKL